MVASATNCQDVWIRDLVIKINGKKIQEVVLQINNTYTITLVKNPIFLGRSKHIKSWFHYIHEGADEKEIMVEHINGKEQGADILTKALAKDKYTGMHKLLGLKNLSISSQK